MEKELNSYNHWMSLHLDEEQQAKFLANVDNEMDSIDPALEVEEKAFIYSAFVWERSNEGHDYWMNVQDKLETQHGWQE